MKVKDKIYRNAQEQLLYNSNVIEQFLAGEKTIAEFGIHVIGIYNAIEDAPVTDLSVGDCVLIGDAAPYTYYVWTDDRGVYEWVNIGVFPQPGPQGEQGPEGPQGPEGDASKWYYGNLPGPSGYSEGDMWLDPKGNVYTLIDGHWVSTLNITGPRGFQGDRGAKGDTGETGATGPRGPRGAQGAPYIIKEILPTVEDLEYKTLEENIAYLVGTEAPYDIYIVIDNHWTNIGNSMISSSLLDKGPYIVSYNLILEANDLATRIGHIDSGKNQYIEMDKKGLDFYMDDTSIMTVTDKKLRVNGIEANSVKVSGVELDVEALNTLITSVISEKTDFNFTSWKDILPLLKAGLYSTTPEFSPSVGITFYLRDEGQLNSGDITSNGIEWTGDGSRRGWYAQLPNMYSIFEDVSASYDLPQTIKYGGGFIVPEDYEGDASIGAIFINIGRISTGEVQSNYEMRIQANYNGSEIEYSLKVGANNYPLGNNLDNLTIKVFKGKVTFINDSYNYELADQCPWGCQIMQVNTSISNKGSAKDNVTVYAKELSFN